MTSPYFRCCLVSYSVTYQMTLCRLKYTMSHKIYIFLCQYVQIHFRKESVHSTKMNGTLLIAGVYFAIKYEMPKDP